MQNVGRRAGEPQCRGYKGLSSGDPTRGSRAGIKPGPPHNASRLWGKLADAN